MSRNPVIRAYCQQVGKALELPRTHKRHLLDGLERELEERFSSEAGVTLETLCRDAGSPEESALALMECVGERERTFYLSRQKLLMRIINANQELKRGRKTTQKSRECKNVANKSHQALLRCLRQ